MHFGILCLLTLIRTFPTEASVYYEYTKHVTWSEANSSCSLALPVFWNDLKGQNVVNISNNVATDLWVGYFKAQTGFEYKGCIRNEKFTPQMDSERITIGQCYSACGRKQMIGISGKKCYCEDQFNFNEGFQRTFCYNCRGCSANVSNTCDENDCLSVYKVDQNVTKCQKLNIVDGMCLKFSGNETVLHKRYMWTDCKHHNRAFCENQEGTQYFNSADNWRESANWCFAYKNNPLTYAKLQAINDSTENPVWTSIISSNVIYTYAEYDKRLTKIRFGYLKSKGSHTVLKFKAATTQKALCRNVSRESPETSTTVSTPRRHVSTDNVSTESPETSTTVSTPRRHVSTDNDVSTSVSEPDPATLPPDMSTGSGSMDWNEEQNVDNQDFSTSVPKTETSTPRGVSTDPGFVDPDEEQNADNKDSSSAAPEPEAETPPPVMSTDPEFMDSNEEQSADKQDSDVRPIIGASVGSVLLVVGVVVCAVMILKRRNRCKCANKRTNSRDTSSNCHMIQENYSHDHAVDITKTDTTYDTTGSAKKNKEVETGNIYNKLDTDINATYDHAYSKRKDVASKADDTYDTAEMEALESKPDNKPDRFGDTDEDAYNHINGEQLKTCKTDNVYGISSFLGNGAREQGISNIKDAQSEGDTYCHINNASRKCSKPDNVYGVPNKLHTSNEETKHQEGDYDVSDKDIQVLDTDNEYSEIGTLS